MTRLARDKSTDWDAQCEHPDFRTWVGSDGLGSSRELWAAAQQHAARTGHRVEVIKTVSTFITRRPGRRRPRHAEGG